MLFWVMGVLGESRVEKVGSRLQGWGVSRSAGWSGMKGWCLNMEEVREWDVLMTKGRQQVHRPWDGSISVVFRKSNEASVGSVEGTGETTRWGGLEGSGGTCTPSKGLQLGGFEQRKGMIWCPGGRVDGEIEEEAVTVIEERGDGGVGWWRGWAVVEVGFPDRLVVEWYSDDSGVEVKDTSKVLAWAV